MHEIQKYSAPQVTKVAPDAVVAVEVKAEVVRYESSRETRNVATFRGRRRDGAFCALRRSEPITNTAQKVKESGMILESPQVKKARSWRWP